jgi:alkanesulfonate monooxygenase SsuD/methylene tetrahydromethanopterin reductase-like flavin-dependent oxidoreductase (luciferase family)
VLRPAFPPALAAQFAERLEAGGVDQLWVIEDVFHTTGVTLAAPALSRTTELTVGLGILPAVARNPAVAATAGRVADGLVLAEGAGPSYVRSAIAQAGDLLPFRVAAFTALCVTNDPRDARRQHDAVRRATAGVADGQRPGTSARR